MAKNHPPHGVRQTSQFNQSKNNRYQQTWHTIEFSNNRHIRILPKQFRFIIENLCFAFLRCDVSSLFHSFSLCKSGIFTRYSHRGMNQPITNGSFSSFMLVVEELLLSEGSLSPLSGGDSEDITRSPAAVQIGCGGACILPVPVLDAAHLNCGQVLLAPANQQVLAVQQLGRWDHRVRIRDFGVVDIGAALSDDTACG